MDLVCTSCGEPWDLDYVLHDEPEGFTREGAAIVSCPCCKERGHGKDLGPEARERLSAARELGQLLGGGSGDDLLECIDELRSYGANLILAHQGTSQLIPPDNSGDRRLRDSVLGRTQVRAYFATGHREADEDLWGELFADQLPAALKERKHTVVTKWLRPELGTATTHAHSEGQSGSGGEGVSVTEPNLPPGFGGALPTKTHSTLDYHVELEHNYYSVPYQLVHRKVDVRATTHTIEIFHFHKRVASHIRRYGRP